MVTVVDYGVGNLFSLRSSFGYIGEEAIVASDCAEIESAERIILPGVGAFGDAAQKLREKKLDALLKKKAEQGTPIMGICLGMQLLFDESYEFGVHKGLSLIGGKVVPIENVISKGLKIPHIGWNPLVLGTPRHYIFKDISDGDCVYFVHSYYADTEKESIIATAEYGAPLTAAVAKDNVVGCQFHPEKSGAVGLKILKAFCEWSGK